MSTNKSEILFKSINSSNIYFNTLSEKKKKKAGLEV